METVREALDKKRETLKGKVSAIFLCKRELFYGLLAGGNHDDSIYPVSSKTAHEEAEYFDVECEEV